MTVDPAEIRSATFPQAWPGYDRAEVDAFLAKVADDVARDEFLEAGHEVAEALRMLHDDVVAVRRQAEEDAKELIRVAEADATHLLADADVAARAVRTAAEEDAAAMRSAAETEVSEARSLAAEILVEARDAVVAMQADQERRAEEEVVRRLAARSDELAETAARHRELLEIEADLREHLFELGNRIVGLAGDAVLDLRDDPASGGGGPRGTPHLGDAPHLDDAGVDAEGARSGPPRGAGASRSPDPHPAEHT